MPVLPLLNFRLLMTIILSTFLCFAFGQETTQSDQSNTDDNSNQPVTAASDRGFGFPSSSAVMDVQMNSINDFMGQFGKHNNKPSSSSSSSSSFSSSTSSNGGSPSGLGSSSSYQYASSPSGYSVSSSTSGSSGPGFSSSSSYSSSSSSNGNGQPNSNPQQYSSASNSGSSPQATPSQPQAPQVSPQSPSVPQYPNPQASNQSPLSSNPANSFPQTPNTPPTQNYPIQQGNPQTPFPSSSPQIGNPQTPTLPAATGPKAPASLGTPYSPEERFPVQYPSSTYPGSSSTAQQCPDSHSKTVCKMWMKLGRCRHRKTKFVWCPQTCGQLGPCQQQTGTKSHTKKLLLSGLAGALTAGLIKKFVGRNTQQPPLAGLQPTPNQGYSNLQQPESDGTLVPTNPSMGTVYPSQTYQTSPVYTQVQPAQMVPSMQFSPVMVANAAPSIPTIMSSSNPVSVITTQQVNPVVVTQTAVHPVVQVAQPQVVQVPLAAAPVTTVNNVLTPSVAGTLFNPSGTQYTGSTLINPSGTLVNPSGSLYTPVNTVVQQAFDCRKAIVASLCYSPDVCYHCRNECSVLGYCRS